MSPSSSCAATTTIRERLECLADVLAIDDPVSNRHVVDALGAVASLEQLVEAAQTHLDHTKMLCGENRFDLNTGDAACPTYHTLAAALAAVGPGEETAE